MLNASKIMELQKLSGMEKFSKRTIAEELERQKVVELILSTKVGMCIGNRMKAEEVADNLIANGVTVQQWIPVTERLPEKHGKYLAVTPSKLVGCEHSVWLVWYDPEGGFYDSDPEWGDIPMDDVTHWMPLPEPPKEPQR